MEFEWDEAKRTSNVHKHRLDFIDVVELFDGRPIMTRVNSRSEEMRRITTGKLSGRMITIIWTLRDGRVRVISARSARNEEERAYRQIYG